MKVEKIQPGYKHTELGWIPAEWEVKNLAQIGNFKKGKGIKKDQVSVDGVGCVRYGELYTHYDSIIKSTRSKISPDLIPETQKIEFGDLLFAGSGETKEEIGKCAAFLGSEETYAGGDIVILSPKSSDSCFLGYSLNHSQVAKQKAQYGQGDAVVHIYPNGLGKVKIPLPPLPEQQSIATTLSDMDAYIRSLEQLIEKKKAIKQAAMQELLTPKEDWEVRKLGDIVSEARLGGNYPNDNIENQYPLVKMGNLLRGEISTEKLEYISGNSLPNQKDRLKLGDFLFNTRNTLELVGKVAIWRDELPEAYYNSNLMKIEFDKRFVASSFFMNYFFNGKTMISKLSGIATGTTSVAAIYTRDLYQLEISLPPLETQKNVVDLVETMFQEIQNLQRLLMKSNFIKQAMMQDLLTGKVRLV